MLKKQHMPPDRDSPLPARLSRREREIMEIVYRLGRASVTEVRGAMAQPPTYSAVRAALRLLDERGHLTHEEVAGAYIYAPKVSREKARVSLLQQMLRTFFNSSAEEMVSTLLDTRETRLSAAELDRMALLIEKARRTRKP